MSYTTFATCQIDRERLFQLGADRTCQVLIPDPDPLVLKFTVEEREPHPKQAEWLSAVLIALPDERVLVAGPIWSNCYTPWIYSLKEN